jgi:hypothetical protein
MTSKNLVLAILLLGCGGTHSPSPTGPMPADSPADSPTVKGISDRTAGDPTTPMPSDPPAPSNPPMPSNPPAPMDAGPIISFSQDVVPIFGKRLCDQCHSEDAPGADLGGLSLNGSPNHIYKQVAVNLSPNFNTTRVDLKDPEKSLLLTMPGPEVDKHPVVVFTSPADPDYQTILEWIRQGAKPN